MVINMNIDKYYVITNNVVTNIALYREEDALRLKLKRYPITDELGTAQIGWTYLPIEDRFLPPPRDILAEWALVEANKLSLLASSDPFVMPDVWATYNQDEQQQMIEYRQKLRNIRKDVIDPHDIVWPDLPPIMLQKLEENKFTTFDPEI
jgi:hypothetical protein